MDTSSNSPGEMHFFCHRCLIHFTMMSSANISCPNCHDDFVESVTPSPLEPAQPRRFTGMNVLRPTDISQALTVPEELLATIFQFYERLAVSGPPPASRDDLRHLVDYKITQEDIENRKDCPICMEDFKLDEVSKRLPCKHSFHERCILQWLEQRGTCPVCRRNLQGTDTSRQEYVIPFGIENTYSNPSFSLLDNFTQSSPSSSTRETRSEIFLSDNAHNQSANNNNPVYDTTAFILSNANPLFVHSNNTNASRQASTPTITEQVVIMNTDNASLLNDNVNNVLQATLNALAHGTETTTVPNNGSSPITTSSATSSSNTNPNSQTSTTVTISQSDPNIIGITTSFLSGPEIHSATNNRHGTRPGWFSPNSLIHNLTSAVSRYIVPNQQGENTRSGNSASTSSSSAQQSSNQGLPSVDVEHDNCSSNGTPLQDDID